MGGSPAVLFLLESPLACSLADSSSLVVQPLWLIIRVCAVPPLILIKYGNLCEYFLHQFKYLSGRVWNFLVLKNQGQGSSRLKVDGMREKKLTTAPEH